MFAAGTDKNRTRLLVGRLQLRCRMCGTLGSQDPSPAVSSADANCSNPFERSSNRVASCLGLKLEELPHLLSPQSPRHNLKATLAPDQGRPERMVRLWWTSRPR